MIERVIWDGIDLGERFGVFLGGMTEEPPTAKTDTVAIAYGNDIDATEANGPVAFNNRLQSWTLVYHGGSSIEDAQEAYEAVLNFLGGSAADFVLSRDPNATYHGRADVDGATVTRHGVALLEIKVNCSPWRSLGEVVKTVNAAGGGFVSFAGPKDPVQPVFSCDTAFIVVWNGEERELPPGSFRISDWFTQRDNTFLAVSTETEELHTNDVLNGAVIADMTTASIADEQTWGICFRSNGGDVPASATIEWREL